MNRPSRRRLAIAHQGPLRRRHSRAEQWRPGRCWAARADADRIAHRHHHRLSAAGHERSCRGCGKEVSRDVIGRLKRLDLIAAGPRAPEPGAPYAYVTTRKFLEVFGLASLRDLPDIERLEDAGLSQRPANEIDLDGVLGIRDDDAELVNEMEGKD